MTVVAVSVPGQPGWRWRIVDYHGETVEESDAIYGTMALALAEGRERLRHQPRRDAPIQRQRSS
jgi:hypothetical protein